MLQWPTLEIKKTTLEDLSAADAGDEYEEEVAPVADGAVDTAWDDEFAGDDVGAGMGGADEDDFDMGDGGWGDDLDLGDDFGEEAKSTPVDEMAGLDQISDDAGFQMPPAGRPPAGCWAQNSSHAADHMAGKFNCHDCICC